MKKLSLLSLFVLSLLALLGCAAKEVAKAPSITPGPTVASVRENLPAWQIEWERLVKEAQKEGRITIVTSAGAPVRLALIGSLRKKFGIEADVTSGRGGELAERLMSQRKAGLYLLDIYLAGITTVHTRIKPAGVLEPLEPQFVLPELKDPDAIKKNWWGGDFRWLDDQHLSMAIATYASPSLGVNTNLVKPGEIKGYADLLNPRWKGKIILNDPTQTGTGGKHFGVVGSRIMNWDYWREMVKQDPVIVVDQRQMVEWLAQGKYAALVGVLPEIANEFMQAGAPIAFVRPVEGGYLTSGHGTISLINRAPHPAAAKIFINWILTKEGMSVMSQALATPSSRLDVSIEGIDAALILQPGIKYVVTDDEKFSVEQPEHFLKAREIFGHLLK